MSEITDNEAIAHPKLFALRFRQIEAELQDSVLAKFIIANAEQRAREAFMSFLTVTPTDSAAVTAIQGKVNAWLGIHDWLLALAQDGTIAARLAAAEDERKTRGF